MLYLPRGGLRKHKSTVCGLNGSPPRLANLARRLPFKSSDPSRYTRVSCAFQAFLRGALLALRFRLEKYATAFFLVRKQQTTKK
jgi:hypothetical protein